MRKILKHLFESLQDFTTLAAFTAIAIFLLFGVGPLFP